MKAWQKVQAAAVTHVPNVGYTTDFWSCGAPGAPARAEDYPYHHWEEITCIECVRHWANEGNYPAREQLHALLKR